VAYDVGVSRRSSSGTRRKRLVSTWVGLNMPELELSVLLLSSNARRRYAEDILTGLALPEGAVIQFRYEADYVAPTLQQIVANGRIIGATAVLGFIADADTQTPFVLPIRIAAIIQAENVADMFIMKLRVGGYPDPGDSPMSLPEIHSESKKFHAKIVQSNSGHYYPATNKFPSFHLNSTGDPAQKWIGIVRRLALHSTFATSYFMRIDSPVSTSRRAVSFDQAGVLHLADGQSVKVPVSFYSTQYSEGSRVVLSCTTDGTFLKVSSDDTYDVALRYDSVEFWLQPRTELFDALARATIRLTSDPGIGPAPLPLTTNTYFPVVVMRSRSQLALKIAGTAVGAFLVALPAILGQASSLRLRVLVAVLGALLLAYSTIAISRVGSG
jgi:hypothetical protein